MKRPVSYSDSIIPILAFLIILVYGLFGHPLIFGGDMLKIEVLVLLAISFGIFYLFSLGYKWKTIENHIKKKVGEAVPVILILFAVGVLIGSWIVSGTIPMLIYYGISLIDPSWIYIFSFVICIVFSLLTGTSWGSAGTIGVVMIGIAQVYDANLAITAAAIVGGSFFGDKLSPLSDTTNIASLATDVSVYDHISSMCYTTFPAAIVALVFYGVYSYNFGQEIADNAIRLESIETTLNDLESIFQFHVLLLLPLLVVIVASVFRKPIFITLLSASWVALILGLIFQSFSVNDIFAALKSGFSPAMVDESIVIQSDVLSILNRGGLYNLIEGIVIAFLVFTLIGVFDVINAIETSIAGIMNKLRNSRQLVVTTLSATWLTNLTTSNQYATSFIIGAAFKEKFDELGIDRKVLSRSIEDAGTMLENLMPWTPSGIFMSMTLGVGVWTYAPYQILSITNIFIAYFFALTGIAIFKQRSLQDEKRVEIKD